MDDDDDDDDEDEDEDEVLNMPLRLVPLAPHDAAGPTSLGGDQAST